MEQFGRSDETEWKIPCSGTGVSSGKEAFKCEKKIMEMEKEYREQRQKNQGTYKRNQEVYNDKNKELLEKLEFYGKAEW